MLCNILLLFLLAAELSKLLANNFLMSLLQISDCVKKKLKLNYSDLIQLYLGSVLYVFRQISLPSKTA